MSVFPRRVTITDYFTYAAVFPDPVMALAKISLPSKAKGMAFSYRIRFYCQENFPRRIKAKWNKTKCLLVTYEDFKHIVYKKH